MCAAVVTQHRNDIIVVFVVRHKYNMKLLLIASDLLDRYTTILVYVQYVHVIACNVFGKLSRARAETDCNYTVVIYYNVMIIYHSRITVINKLRARARPRPRPR